MRAVLTRKRKVKIKTEAIKEPITTKERLRLVCPFTTALPKTIGNIGKTQGVKTVSNPAIKEMIKNIISSLYQDYLILATISARVLEPVHFLIKLPEESTWTKVC